MQSVLFVIWTAELLYLIFFLIYNSTPFLSLDDSLKVINSLDLNFVILSDLLMFLLRVNKILYFLFPLIVFVNWLNHIVCKRKCLSKQNYPSEYYLCKTYSIPCILNWFRILLNEHGDHKNSNETQFAHLVANTK